MPQTQVMEPPAMAGRLALRRSLLIGLIAFLTLVDLFAAQAILPSLAARYGVSPAEMGTAVNATTLGMAVAALGVALFGRRLPRRCGTAVAGCATSRQWGWRSAIAASSRCR